MSVVAIAHKMEALGYSELSLAEWEQLLKRTPQLS